MQFKSMEFAIAVAVLAATVGGATGGQLEKASWKTIGEGVAVAFAAFAGIKVVKLLEAVVDQLQWIGEKCNYIEKRIDASAAKSTDVCRHLQQVFLEFDVELNEAQTVEMKWWWVERRLRQLYEDFSNCEAMEKCSYEDVKKTWSMLQLEVKMRTLRDVISYRHFGEKPSGEDDDMEWALKNMNAALQCCTFWKPMQLSEFEEHKAGSCYEEMMMSQIAERVQEVKKYLEGSDLKKFKGLELDGFLGGSSNA